MLDTGSSFVEIVPGGRVDGTVRPPGSKSLTNRALICAAFAEGPSTLTGALRSEDTEVMIAALGKIGIQIEALEGGRTLSIDTTTRRLADPRPEPIELFIANSGTSVRFLAAALSAAGGNYRLHGVDRMHQRPIGDLVKAIARVIDGSIEAISAGGCPPLRIDSCGWSGRDITVAGTVSSQYLSGLMMAAPIAQARRDADRTLRIGVIGELVSRPYVDMTAEVMRCFGAEVDLVEHDLVAGQTLAVDVGAAAYRGIAYAIEPDASAASYFWATAAITGGEITVEGLSRTAMQGDVGFCDVLAKMGCDVQYGPDRITVIGRPLRGVDVDMNEISDTVQTLSVVALFASGPTRVRGVAHNRFKETDRIGDLACELRKLGAIIEEHADGLTIVPPDNASGLHAATLETYHDHRMAMSLSLAGSARCRREDPEPCLHVQNLSRIFRGSGAAHRRAHRWASG